jgi:heptosyltransferase-3
VKDIQRILVIATRQMGDVLLTTPLIHAAKLRWPDATIDVLGFAGTLGFLRGNPEVRELIEVAAGSGWLKSWPLIRRLWRRYDLALIAQYQDRAHLYGWVAARVRSGLIPVQRATSWWKRRLLVHAVVVGQEPTSAVLDKLKLLAPWSAEPPSVDVHAPPGHALPADVAASLGSGYIVLQVPALVNYKQWPLHHQQELVRGLLDDGHQIVLSGGPSPADRAKNAEVARVAAPPRVLDVGGRLDLNQMVTLLRNAAFYIGPDTSITHLAAACGVPLLALYGPIDPRVWGPWPQGSAPVQRYVSRAPRQQLGCITLLQGTPLCVPCNQAGCERNNESRSECLETMSAQRVLAEVRAVLGTGHRAGNGGASAHSLKPGIVREAT